MIRIVNIRLVVEKPSTHAKYYPQVISASTQQSYPFSVSGAEINVVSNNSPSSSGYASPINFDDIIRLQVSVKMDKNEKTVWQDLFHGRIENLSSEFGTGNQLKIYAVGHEAELKTDLISEAKEYTTSTDAKILLSYFSRYFNRLTYLDSRASTGVSFPTYDSNADQMYLSDLIGDMETNSGGKWIFEVIPTYDSSKNLSTRYVSWRQFVTAGSFTATPVKSYKVIEGTRRLIAADFDVEGEGVFTFHRVYGATSDGGLQYKGSAVDAALLALYGRRSTVDTYPWIKSNSLCDSVATGLLSSEKDPETSGQVLLIGTPQAKLGDYVYVKIPSEEINGASILGYFYVKRVQHMIDRGKFHTRLDFGKVKKEAEDYIAKVSATTKLCKKSLVK